MNLMKQKHIVPVFLVLAAVLGMASCKSTAKPVSMAAPAASDPSAQTGSQAAASESEASTQSPAQTGSQAAALSGDPLPAQYMVRPWSESEDTLKSIAARPWVYGDESEWPRLYNANRNKLPDPNNPDMLMPGIVLDIPSMEGETRSGLWEEGRSYPSLSRVLAASIPADALPAKYRVRPWSISQDTLQSIAGRPWAYNDAGKWRTLYDVNRNKLPQPDNPDLIMPGLVLDIPSIQGELRAGMWDPDRAYTPLVPASPSGWQ
jgi:nucleoid-associated protein YgaU